MTLKHYLKYVAAMAALLLAGQTAPVFAQTPAENPAQAQPAVAKVAETAPVEPSGLLPDRPFNDADLWQRIRRGFALNELDTPLVQDHEQWYSNRPDYIQRFVDRGSRYLYHVVEEVERRGMPTEVALLPIIESAFNPQAYSRAKAAGMWQFIPSTGKNFGLKQDWLADNRRDVLLSTHAALDYLQKLYGMFNSWELAFAAYNCGEGCVMRAIQKNQRKGLPTDFLSLNLPPETRNYVPKLIAVKNIVLSPATYGIDLNSVENRPYFAKVPAPPKMDVKLAARLAEMDEDEFAALNPASNKPVATTSTGTFLVPADKVDVFSENLELYRSLNGPMVSWQAVTAKRGESVDAVARRYGMTASYLRATNGPLKEKKGKLTQPVTFMVPMQKEAKAINEALDRKVALKASQPPKQEAAGASAEPEPNDKIAAAAPTAVPTSTPAASAPHADTPALVPVKEPAVPAPAAPVLAASTVATDDTRPARYRVQKGDTLFSIARRFNVGVEQVKTHNALKGNAVMVGQELALPVAGEAAGGLVRVSAATKQPRAASTTTYVVRTGDTLFGIAVKFGVDLDDLMRWNKLTSRSVLQPGNRLRVSG